MLDIRPVLRRLHVVSACDTGRGRILRSWDRRRVVPFRSVRHARRLSQRSPARPREEFCHEMSVRNAEGQATPSHLIRTRVIGLSNTKCSYCCGHRMNGCLSVIFVSLTVIGARSLCNARLHADGIRFVLLHTHYSPALAA
jgi:hypothetical protein